MPGVGGRTVEFADDDAVRAFVKSRSERRRKERRANNPNAISGINHVCYTIENFDPERVMAILIDNGFAPIESGIPALVKPLTSWVRWRQRANNGGGPSSRII